MNALHWYNDTRQLLADKNLLKETNDAANAMNVTDTESLNKSALGWVCLGAALAVSGLSGCIPDSQFSGKYSCSYTKLHSEKMFGCDASLGLSRIVRGWHDTYNKSRLHFPQAWNQLGANQAHDATFTNSLDAAPNFWAAPLTGIEYQRLRKALDVFPNNGGQTWASTAAAGFSNVMGVSVAQGIVFAQLSNQEIYAIDATSGDIIWSQDLINVAGMGQSVVGMVNNRLMVFVPVGDANYNLTNTVNFKNKQPHNRGAQFGGLFAFDALTGQALWEFPTEAAARPSPVLHNGTLYLATSGGDFYTINAADGKLLGSTVNPGGGYPGLASVNWYETKTGKLHIVYGTLRPRNIIAMDVTNPSAPSLAWSYSPPGATANSTGDTSVAIDQARGLVLTTVFTATASATVFDLTVLALNAEDGTPVWSQLSGTGPNIPGFKASIPMIHQDTVYVGNSLSQDLQAYNINTGERLWVTSLRDADDPATRRRRPGGAGVFFEGKFIHAEGNKIRTLDPTTGEILNVFKTSADNFAVWAITQPAIVGRQMYLGAHSGWVFNVPVDYVMNNPGIETDPGFHKEIPLRSAEQFRRMHAPSDAVRNQFGNTWDAYAGGATLNSVHPQGMRNVRWSSALEKAIPLADPPRDEGIYGTELASNMTHLAFGAGAGVSPANGMVYVGSGQNALHALNAQTGELVWRHTSVNSTHSQPLVTPDSIIAASGDQFMNLASTGRFSAGATNTQVFSNFEYITAVDPDNGREQWTVFSGTGTSAMTPLLHQGSLYWITGSGEVWAIDAKTGQPVSPLMDADYNASIKLGGFNVLSSANVYTQANAGDIMIAGAAMPNQVVGINLAAGAIAWQQDFVPFNTYTTGFANSALAIDQGRSLAIGSVLIDANVSANSISVMAYALDTTSGAIVWTTNLGSGAIPIGFSSPTPVIDADHAYFNNPLSNTVVALNLQTGSQTWQSSVAGAAGKPSWGQGVLVGTKLIQPIGSTLVTFDRATGTQLNSLPVGGAFTYNHPTVAGKTLYIGNSWGWVLAYPLGDVTGDPTDN